MKKLLLAAIFVLTGIVASSQTYLVNQHFSNISPSGWLSTGSPGSPNWNFTYNGASTTNYRPDYDATKYSARFSSAATGNNIYLYIPISFISGNTYTITFYTKRACSVRVYTNELPNQNTLLTKDSTTNSGCNSNWNAWYQWSFTILSNYTGSGYFQIGIKTVYGGPASVYLDDVSIFESEPVDLPIELLYFKGSVYNFENILHWSTASEHNNDYFTIEKTKDGIDYTTVAIIEGAGNSTTRLYYEYIDENITSEILYYRLKQTDYDGRFEYSPIISIDNRSNRTKIVVKVINLFGSEVDIKTSGILILIYDDGSIKKIYNE